MWTMTFRRFVMSTAFRWRTAKNNLIGQSRITTCASAAGAAAAQPPRRSRKNSIPAAAEAPTQRGPGSSRSGVGSGRENSATNGCWQFDHGKQGCREQVVLAGLIYHPELTMRLGFRIWESLINLTGLE